MLTLGTLVREMGLELACGEEAADAPLRWVHITELSDPTPWLSGGELILTTGLQLTSPKRQRQFVRRLADHHLAGLGVGTGFTHDGVPEGILEESRRLGFPVFEVPYELPFIAITEKAFTRLVNEQYEVLKRGISIHKRLERLVLEERGLDELVRALSAAIGGAVMVLDGRGETLAERAFRRPLSDDAVAFLRGDVTRRTASIGRSDRGAAGAERAFLRPLSDNAVAFLRDDVTRRTASIGRSERGAAGAEFNPDHPDMQGRSLVLPVATRGRGAPQAWLVATRDGGVLGDFERLILQQAVTVVALELMRRRAMRDTERRLAGDVLAEALTGRLGEREVESRMHPFGIGSSAAVLVFDVDSPTAAEADLDRFLREAGVGTLVATRDDLLCAVVDCPEDLDPIELAGRAREALADTHGEVRAATSRSSPVGGLRRSFHEARCALEATALRNGSAPEVASYQDLGAFQLLLSLQDDDALRLYCDSVLGPLEEGGEYGDELTRSLEAFIENNGQWEKAARKLFCHRHTLRYRIRRVEELTGRDLGAARDRIEFWLALRARELVS